MKPISKVQATNILVQMRGVAQYVKENKREVERRVAQAGLDANRLALALHGWKIVGDLEEIERIKKNK